MKVTLYIAATINGFIARNDDSTPWSDEEWNAYIDVVKRVGNIIIGSKTYEIMKIEELERIGNPFTVVISSKQSNNENPNVVFASSPEEALKVLTERNYTETLLNGGSQTIDAFTKKNLIDEIMIDVEPYIFGSGKPLILPSNLEYKLSLKDFKKIGNNTVQLYYTVVK